MKCVGDSKLVPEMLYDKRLTDTEEYQLLANQICGAIERRNPKVMTSVRPNKLEGQFWEGIITMFNPSVGVLLHEIAHFLQWEYAENTDHRGKFKKYHELVYKVYKEIV